MTRITLPWRSHALLRLSSKDAGISAAAFGSDGADCVGMVGGCFLGETMTQAHRRAPVNPETGGQSKMTLPLYLWMGRTPTGLVRSARTASTAARAPPIVVMMHTLW